MDRSRSTGRAALLAIVLTAAGGLAACTAPGSSPSPAVSAAPSDMMEHSPSASDMMEHSPSPSDMMEHSPSPS